MCGLISGFSWSVWQALKIGVPHLRQLHQVPCDRCLYATGDYRLKCTVCPCTAFSLAAIDCRDFVPTDRIVPHPSNSRRSSKMDL
jgi:hypothetical protein